MFERTTFDLERGEGAVHWLGGPTNDLSHCSFTHLCCFSAIALAVCAIICLAML